MQKIGFEILNEILWHKTDATPNFSCTRFVADHENFIWARKGEKHTFNYELMKKMNGGTQMRCVWSKGKTTGGKKIHPTQKPEWLLERIILASTGKNAWVLDPYTGSSTTGIASNLANRKFLGIDKEEEFLNISKKRKLEIENPQIFGTYRKKLGGFEDKNQLEFFLAKEPEIEYERSLNFGKITTSPPLC